MIEVSMTRILVVDDSTFNLKIITASLTPSGYEVVTANNGREALDCVDAMLPDLIILDVMMPELNGYEVCRRLRSKPTIANRPIMMLTAQDSLEERINGLEAGADDYMCKPFETDELQARVKALLRRTTPTNLQPEAAGRQGKVITTFSLRGGVGVSTLAANLAVALAQLWGRPTALVDLATKPIGAGLEDCAFFVSKGHDRTERPAKPTETWQRVVQRAQQRRQQRVS